MFKLVVTWPAANIGNITTATGMKPTYSLHVPLLCRIQGVHVDVPIVHNPPSYCSAIRGVTVRCHSPEEGAVWVQRTQELPEGAQVL